MSEENKEIKLTTEDPEGLVRDCTQSNIFVKAVYNPDDLKDMDYEKDIADPGQFPYTRGLYPEMFRNKLWLKSFLVSYDTPENTNAAFKQFIAQGMNDLRITTDLTSQAGFDPDHPIAEASMFCGGINAYAINTYERVVKDLPLAGTIYELGSQSVFGSVYSYCLMVGMMEKRGFDLKDLYGSGITDPIRSKLVYGDPSWPTEVERRVTIDQLEFVLENTPRWKPIVPNGVDPCQSGMNAYHELGEVIACAMGILDDFCARGHEVDEFGPMVFALDIESDFFESIAKCRAARRMWARIMKERYHAKKSSTMKLKIGIRTSGMSLTAQKPLNNAARIVLQTLACVFAGVNSIDACSMDEALGLPSSDARSLALDTQHIIAHETNVPLVADPLGGSYYLEWMTNKLEEEAYKFIDEIEQHGGVFKALESGWLNQITEQDRLTVQKEKANGTRIIVGYNAYNKGGDGPINQAVADCAYTVPGKEARQAVVQEFKDFCATRDMDKLADTMRRLYLDTKEGRNIIRTMVDGVKEGMTVGEACGIVRMGYGLEYDSVSVIDTPEHVKEALKDVL